MNHPHGDAAWHRREASRKRKAFIWQSAILVVLTIIFGSFIFNISANLAARNIHSGFAFLHEQAGFEIGESLISFSSTEAYFKAFLVGLLNTIKVSVVSIITATVLGVIIGLMRLSKHPLLKFLGAAHVEFYRNIPLIVQLLLIYLIITELLPDSMEAVNFGSWGLLSKAGLQFAVPASNSTACTWSFVAAGLAFFLTRPLSSRLHRFNFDGFSRFRQRLLSEVLPAVLRDLRRMVQTGTAGIRNRRRRLPLAGIFSALDRTDILYLFVYRRNYPSRCISRAERTVACR